MRFGTVTLVGRSNVGKSTFLNACLGVDLAIVSARPQTTRDTLLGIAARGDAQIAFLDTPGLHRAKTELGRRMNAAAQHATRSADVVLVMTDRCAAPGPGARPVPDPDDQPLLDLVPNATPCVVVINKVDQLADKSILLPALDAFWSYRPCAAVVPASVRCPEDVERILDEIVRVLPEGPPGYPADTLTDRPTSFFVREFVREQVLRCAGREVPHAVAVSVESVESTARLLVARATIHVEKPGQRKILVGAGGAMIREIGIGARQRLERLVEKKVHLELFVRATPRWKDVPRQLAELGYEAPEGETGAEAGTRPRSGRRAQRGRRS
jgi:GTPase